MWDSGRLPWKQEAEDGIACLVALCLTISSIWASMDALFFDGLNAGLQGSTCPVSCHHCPAGKGTHTLQHEHSGSVSVSRESELCHSMGCGSMSLEIRRVLS